ncbi:hypothetical protein V5799_022571 [Amblyomma americanum]|uniref:Secreted protein n=1 Tax=Amblyomma americanum TaxID=6943 RepID=A0AAQ4FLJ0_AMBAM
MQPPAARFSAPRLLFAATAAILLLQVSGDGAPAKPTTAAQPIDDKAPSIAPAAEGGVTASPKKPKTFGRPLRPFNLGINIPYFFNMRLLTGPAGTGLGLNVPAILNLQLDAAHRRRPGLLLNLFGNGGGILFNRRRRPGNPLAGPGPALPFGQPSEQDNAIDIKRKTSQTFRDTQGRAIAP